MTRQRPKWPLLLLALPAAVSIWAGWVGLGQMTGFGEVQLLPGIWDGLRLNTAITLPVGMEAYAAYALGESLRRDVPARAKRFARRSAMAALVIGCLGQITFHLMQAAGMSTAPWPITMLVSCLPVGVLGMGAALYHLLDDAHDQPLGPPQVSPPPAAPAAPEPGTVPRSAPTTPAPTPEVPRRPPFQAIPNLTTVRPAHPTDARPDAALTGRPEPQPLGRPDAQPTDRPDPTPLGRPDPSPSERPADRAAGRPDTTARPAPSRRPARTRRARKRGARARTDEQLADVVHELATRNGGVAPSQYQVRQALGVGSGRAARLVAAYQPPTTTGSHGITTSESGEGSP